MDSTLTGYYYTITSLHVFKDFCFSCPREDFLLSLPDVTSTPQMLTLFSFKSSPIGVCLSGLRAITLRSYSALRTAAAADLNKDWKALKLV